MSRSKLALLSLVLSGLLFPSFALSAELEQPESIELAAASSFKKPGKFIHCGKFFLKEKKGYGGIRGNRFRVKKRGAVTCRVAMRTARSIRTGGAGWTMTSNGLLLRGKWSCVENPGAGWCEARRGRRAEISWSHRVVYSLRALRKRGVYVGAWEQGHGTFLDQRPRIMFGKRNVRPGSISGRDTWSISRWISWGDRRARARATYWWTKPNMSGHRRYAGTVTLSRIRRCGQVRIYTRIRGTFSGRKPNGMKRTVRIPPVPVSC